MASVQFPLAAVVVVPIVVSVLASRMVMVVLRGAAELPVSWLPIATWRDAFELIIGAAM